MCPPPGPGPVLTSPLEDYRLENATVNALAVPTARPRQVLGRIVSDILGDRVVTGVVLLRSSKATKRRTSAEAAAGQP